MDGILRETLPCTNSMPIEPYEEPWVPNSPNFYQEKSWSQKEEGLRSYQ